MTDTLFKVPVGDVPDGDWIGRTPVLGVQVSVVDLESASQTVMAWIASGSRQFITVTGVHGVMEAQQNPAFKAILNRSSLCVPDGMPLVWLCRWAGKSMVGRVFGPDLMLRVSSLLAAEKRTAFYYGGSEGLAEELAAAMEKRFPGLGTAGSYCPPFRELTDVEIADVASLINASKADVVWVGLSTPKQERWMATFRPLLDVPVLIGVGAAFDYNTGRIERAPRWMQRCALEWLYRLIQEPRRLWRRYLRNNPLFLWYLLCERARLRSFD